MLSNNLSELPSRKTVFGLFKRSMVYQNVSPNPSASNRKTRSSQEEDVENQVKKLAKRNANAEDKEAECSKKALAGKCGLECVVYVYILASGSRIV